MAAPEVKLTVYWSWPQGVEEVDFIMVKLLWFQRMCECKQDKMWNIWKRKAGLGIHFVSLLQNQENEKDLPNQSVYKCLKRKEDLYQVSLLTIQLKVQQNVRYAKRLL